MIYLSLSRNQVKLLYLKKTVFGQHETHFFSKRHELNIIDNKMLTSDDFIASAIKEALTLANSNDIKEKNIFLILPQDMFYFLKTEVSSTLTPNAIISFIKDKIKMDPSVSLDNSYGDYFIKENKGQKLVTFYAINKDVVDKLRKIFLLLDLKITDILPDTLAYFKLIEKTLRQEKKENIFYVSYEKSSLSGYLFDTYGLVSPKLWSEEISKDKSLEKILKEKVIALETASCKLNRLILSGESSENIRQDTFTKDVGVWTNPLKRIIPDFYQDYLKLLIVNPKQNLPILAIDVCLGAFIFSQENKSFSLLKKNLGKVKKSPLILPVVKVPFKEIIIFAISFIASFVLFSFISNRNIKFDFLNSRKFISPTNISPTKPPSPTPTPTISVNKKTLKIKVLNGSGTKGKANEVKDILKEKGYQEILTGNADNFDYEVTELNFKKNFSNLQPVFAEDLKAHITKPKIGKIDDTEASDVIIIIGKDFN